MRPYLVAAIVALAAGAIEAGPARAADFRSIAENGVVLYDGPSTRAKRVFVASRGLPVEIISTDGTWMKIRDPSGDLTWVDRKALSERRTVVVIASVADVREGASDTAPVVFKAAQGVAMDLVDSGGATPGWVRVRHRDGTGGFVRLREIWGV